MEVSDKIEYFSKSPNVYSSFNAWLILSIITKLRC